MVIEGGFDALPDDLQKYGGKLRDIGTKFDEADDTQVSRIPRIAGFINSAIN